MVKNFVLDTRMLLSNASSLFGFEDNNVVVTGTTLQELDRKKGVGGEAGRNAQECCRILDELRERGNLIRGVTMDNGGTLFVEPDGVKQEYLPEGFDVRNPDNRIISACLHLERNGRTPTILVSNDVSMRVNASICGVKVEPYKNDVIEESGYTGLAEIAGTPELIDGLYADGEIPFDGAELTENQFVTMKCGSRSAMTMFSSGRLELVREKTLFGGVRPMNSHQSYAIHALKLPPERTPLVIMKGPAGTAKTFLSLAAGLDDAYSSQKRSGNKYGKILISRPNAEAADPGFGYLPGDLEEKMTPLLAPYFDNLEVLFRLYAPEEEPERIKMMIDDLFEAGVIEVCPLSYIRGRTIPNAFIICDEAQNARRELIRDIVTRAGKGTKVVLCGDPEQIDNPMLDKSNNGLTYAIESMKGSSLTAILEMPKRASVRSDLASEAIRRMATA